MKRNRPTPLTAAITLLAAFAAWTISLRLVDVQAIGPHHSAVGFAALNGLVHRMTGVHMALYTITDWLSLIPLAIVVGFALLGLTQWVRRRSLAKVDLSILVLGGFYALVLAVFLFFEQVVINYRPVLIQGCLEASYPSSTTMLVLCVMPTAAMQLRTRIGNRRLRRWVTVSIPLFTGFMVLARLVSGVHWFTDIVGGILLSGGLVALYSAAICYTEKKSGL